MNEHLLERNKSVMKKLNIEKWRDKYGVTGNGINIAIIGFGGILKHKKPYLEWVNEPYEGTGSYHDGDFIINQGLPNAKIYGINIFKGGWSFSEAMEWVSNNDIDVVCASIKLLSWNDEREELSRKAWEKGIILIDSSDNDGSKGIGYPAKSKYWFACGSVDKYYDDRKGFSSYGMQIDFLSPTNLAVESKEDYFIQISHTSGSPQIATIIAGMLKEYYGKDFNSMDFKGFIMENSIDILDKDWDIESGWGVISLPKELPKIEKTEIVLKIDSNIIKVNGVAKTMDTAAFIKDDRTFVPLRFIVEELGSEVEWNEKERAVTITAP